MSVVVFAGPTLARDSTMEGQSIVWAPPAAHGDLYRAVLHRPLAIGLIDGYFENVPSVWHKEILFALAEGVHVFGAASMGALRAAELHSFGMVGVGAIFEAYRDGVIEDDDEVAIVHGPAELDFLPLTEAMVNIRATVAAAVEATVLGKDSANRVLRVAKDVFYKRRTWPTILGLAAGAGVPAAQVSAFRVWLPEGAVDRKRLDALLLLDRLRDFSSGGAQPHRPNFDFEPTLDWQAAVASFRETG